MEKEMEFSVSVKDLFNTFIRGLWIMLTVAVVFAVIAFSFSKFFIPKTYTSTVKLYVETNKKGETSYNDLSSYNLATSLVNTYIEMLQTNNFYEKVAKNLDNKYTASEISSMVKFSNNSETEVFTASVSAKSPIEAKVVADSVAAVAPNIISALEDNAELKIVDNATIPSRPTSPNVNRNTILAFAVGFLLALIYVFVREALDIKIKYNQDMLEIENIPILAAVPDFSLSSVKFGETDTSININESEGK